MNWRHYLKWGMFILVAIVAFVWLIVNIAKATELPRRDVVADLTPPAATINGQARSVSSMDLAAFDVVATTDSVTIQFELPTYNTLFLVYPHDAGSQVFGQIPLAWPDDPPSSMTYFASAPATLKVPKPDVPVYFVICGWAGAAFWDAGGEYYQYLHEFFPYEGPTTIDMDTHATAGEALLKAVSGQVRVHIPYSVTRFSVVVYQTTSVPYLSWPGGSISYQEAFNLSVYAPYVQIPDPLSGHVVVLVGYRGTYGVSSRFWYMQRIP